MNTTESNDLEMHTLREFDLQSFSSDSYHVINFTSATYHVWGSQTGSAVAAILYSVWIILTNLTFLAVLAMNRRILRRRHNLVLAHSAAIDLGVGVVYFPLTADFFIRGSWRHGCLAFFLWSIIQYPVTFLGCCSVLVLLGLRLAQIYPRFEDTPLRHILGHAVFGGMAIVIWMCMAPILVFLYTGRSEDVHIPIESTVLCRATLTMKRTELLNILTYFLPASLNILLLLAVMIREKTHLFSQVSRIRLGSPDTTTRQLHTPMSLSTLSLITVITIILPLPSFLVSTVTAKRACTCQVADVTNPCPTWLLPLGTISDWVMFAKHGTVSVSLLWSRDFRWLVQGAFHRFRPLPTSGGRHVVDNVEEEAEEPEDSPFSTL